MLDTGRAPETRAFGSFRALNEVNLPRENFLSRFFVFVGEAGGVSNWTLAGASVPVEYDLVCVFGADGD
jgi:hypothetical protein